ncbi:MAG: YbaB/EbfC family nucleoid-associated protein [bacterium]|nr:YbaB/EbfC family nucleoid-associated protein [bacterium]
MFDKLKQISQLKKLQEKMKEEKVENVQNGVKVVLNGKFEIEEIVLNKELSPEEQAETLKNCLNEAIKKIQLEVVQSFSHLV